MTKARSEATGRYWFHDEHRLHAILRPADRRDDVSCLFAAEESARLIENFQFPLGITGFLHKRTDVLVVPPLRETSRIEVNRKQIFLFSVKVFCFFDAFSTNSHERSSGLTVGIAHRSSESDNCDFATATDFSRWDRENS